MDELVFEVVPIAAFEGELMVMDDGVIHRH
jgi:hypothetical protein